MDPRWLTVIVIGVIILIVLDRQNRIHLTETEVLYILAVIPSAILHEVTHGWVALALGDDTAKRAKRLTLNPLVHVSLFGTLLVPAMLVLAGYPPFAWAKPVPVNLSRLRHPRNDHVVVALAGPAMNIVLAVLFGLLFRVIVSLPVRAEIVTGIQLGLPEPGWAQYLYLLGVANVILAVFNLIPIPPLDGSTVLERFIPERWLAGYLSIRSFTMFLPLLIFVFRPNLIFDLYQPFLNFWGHLQGPGFT